MRHRANCRKRTRPTNDVVSATVTEVVVYSKEKG